MDHRFIMTAFGQDRPGIVAEVTRLLFDNGCNLEDTTMTRLAGEFTLIMLFACPDAAAGEALERECRRLERERGISAFLRPVQGPRPEQERVSADCVLHVEGEDQAGIVYKVSRYLARRGLNIVDLTSRVRPAPTSGTPLYVMDIHAQLPADCSLEEVEKGLSEVADDLHVDIQLEKG